MAGSRMIVSSAPIGVCEPLAVADVPVVDVDVDEAAQLALLGHPVAERRVLAEQVVEGLGHRAAAHVDGAAAAGVLAQDRRDADGAHRRRRRGAPARGRPRHTASPRRRPGRRGRARCGPRRRSCPWRRTSAAGRRASHPRPGSSLNTSFAWSRPTMPGRTPSTPATLQAGASSSGGWVGYMQR